MKIPWFTLLIAAGALLAGFSPDLTAAWEGSRVALAGGEGWRLITSHLTHFDANHLGWDLAVWLVLGSWAERQGRRRLVLVTGIAAIAIGLGVWWAEPQFATYRGLSGLDSALFGLVLGSVAHRAWREEDRFSLVCATLGLGSFGLKSAYELIAGTPYFATATGYEAVPLAHALGLVVGLAGAALSHSPQSGESAKAARARALASS